MQDIFADTQNGRYQFMDQNVFGVFYSKKSEKYFILPILLADLADSTFFCFGNTIVSSFTRRFPENFIYLLNIRWTDWMLMARNRFHLNPRYRTRQRNKNCQSGVLHRGGNEARSDSGAASCPRILLRPPSPNPPGNIWMRIWILEVADNNAPVKALPCTFSSRAFRRKQPG